MSWLWSIIIAPIEIPAGIVRIFYDNHLAVKMIRELTIPYDTGLWFSLIVAFWLIGPFVINIYRFEWWLLTKMFKWIDRVTKSDRGIF